MSSVRFFINIGKTDWLCCNALSLFTSCNNLRGNLKLHWIFSQPFYSQCSLLIPLKTSGNLTFFIWYANDQKNQNPKNLFSFLLQLIFWHRENMEILVLFRPNVLFWFPWKCKRPNISYPLIRKLSTKIKILRIYIVLYSNQFFDTRKKWNYICLSFH